MKRSYLLSILSVIAACQNPVPSTVDVRSSQSPTPTPSVPVGSDNPTSPFPSTQPAAPRPLCGILYDTNGSDSPVALVDTDSPYQCDSQITLLGQDPKLQRNRHLFLGWNYAKDGSSKTLQPGTKLTISKNTTLYAIWKLVPKILVTKPTSLTTNEAAGNSSFTVALDSPPAAEATVSFTSDDPTEATISPSSVTFNAENFAVPQTVTITGVDDSVADGNIPYKITIAPIVSNDRDFAGIDPEDIELTSIDDETPGFTLAGTAGLATTESAGTVTFTVVLNSMPTADVSIALSSSNVEEGTVAPSTLLFSPANWNVPQVVTVTGVDDSADDGNVTYSIVSAPAVSSDNRYASLAPDSVTIVNVDNDTAGITIAPTSGLSTAESGATATFSIVLNSKPSAPVEIPLTSSDVSEGTISVSSVIFNQSNWNTAQTITITGVDDGSIDGNISYAIVTGVVISGDALYDDLDPPNPSVINTDNDFVLPGVTVSATSGLSTSEAGGSASFTVVLNAAPSANVSIALTTDTSEGSLSASSLTFTTSNWNTPQTVTIVGVNDAIDDGDVVYSVVLAAAVSADSSYNGINPSDVSVTNVDNDTAGIVVSPTSGLVTTEPGGTASFTVVLSTEPTANVTIGVSSNDLTEGTVSVASLTFTPSNWSTAQTVTVTGANDVATDGHVGYSVVLATPTTSDTVYDDINPSDVSVVNIDNEGVAVTVSPTSGLTTSEGGATATFTVVLGSLPYASVTVPISSGNSSEGSVSPSTLTFTTANWNSPQTVTVTGANDSESDGSVYYFAVVGSTTSTDPTYAGINPSDVRVLNTDNEPGPPGTSCTTPIVLQNTGSTISKEISVSSGVAIWFVGPSDGERYVLSLSQSGTYYTYPSSDCVTSNGSSSSDTTIRNGATTHFVRFVPSAGGIATLQHTLD